MKRGLWGTIPVQGGAGPRGLLCPENTLQIPEKSEKEMRCVVHTSTREVTSMATSVERWVEEQAGFMKPEKIYWVEGTREEMERLLEVGRTEEKIAGRPTFTKMNHDMFPHSFYHQSHPS
jgi:GTP-dependent phosphoenolpyruvate carboxykinase